MRGAAQSRLHYTRVSSGLESEGGSRHALGLVFAAGAVPTKAHPGGNLHKVPLRTVSTRGAADRPTPDKETHFQRRSARPAVADTTAYLISSRLREGPVLTLRHLEDKLRFL